MNLDREKERTSDRLGQFAIKRSGGGGGGRGGVGCSRGEREGRAG